MSPIGIGQELEELLAVQAPRPGAQPERRHERAEGGGDHEPRIRSATQRPASRRVGESATTRSRGIMSGTVAGAVAQGVSLAAAGGVKSAKAPLPRQWLRLKAYLRP